MTDEGVKPTEEWIEAKKVAYPYGYDKGGKLARRLGVTGIPAAFLVDPSGTIVWQGHPGNLTDAVIEQHLEGALAEPLYRWPKEASKARKALLKDDLADALEEAQELAESHPYVLKTVRQVIDGRVASFEQLKASGDFLAMEERGKALAKALKGLPEQEKVEQMLDELDDDEHAQDVIKAQKKVLKLTEGKIKKGRVDRVVRELEEIVEELPDTAAARDAQQAIDRIRAG